MKRLRLLAASTVLIALGLLVSAGELAWGAAVPLNARLQASEPCAGLEPVNVYLSEGPPNATDAAVNLPGVGTLRAAVLFVDFSDAQGTEDPSATLGNWIEPGVDWLRTSSYGRLNITLQPAAGWIRMPQPAADYGFARGLTFAAHEEYIGDAIEVADPTFDFSQTDIVYVVAAKTGLISFSPNFRGVPGTFVADGRNLGPAVTFGLDAYFWGRTIVPHETGHALGLPDLYAFSGDTHRFVGTWDLMGNVFTATDLFAWHRLKLGWLDPGQVVCVPAHAAATVQLAPLGTSMVVDPPNSPNPFRKAVFVRTGPTTGLLVENRQREGNDSSICDTGALVYTVDSSIATGLGPINVVGGTTAGCGSGRLSDAPLHSGETVTVNAVSIAVLASHSPNVVVRVTVP